MSQTKVIAGELQGLLGDNDDELNAEYDTLPSPPHTANMPTFLSAGHTSSPPREVTIDERKSPLRVDSGEGGSSAPNCDSLCDSPFLNEFNADSP